MSVRVLMSNQHHQNQRGQQIALRALRELPRRLLNQRPQRRLRTKLRLSSQQRMNPRRKQSKSHSSRGCVFTLQPIRGCHRSFLCLFSTSFSFFITIRPSRRIFSFFIAHSLPTTLGSLSSSSDHHPLHSCRSKCRPRRMFLPQHLADLYGERRLPQPKSSLKRLPVADVQLHPRRLLLYLRLSPERPLSSTLKLVSRISSL